MEDMFLLPTTKGAEVNKPTGDGSCVGDQQLGKQDVAPIDTEPSEPVAAEWGQMSADKLHSLVRALLGLSTLQSSPTSNTDQSARLGTSWLETKLLQAGCVRAALLSASRQLTALQASARVHSSSTSTQDVALISSAINHTLILAQAATRLMADGKLVTACETALESHRIAHAAQRHPSLLPMPNLPLDEALASYAPLLLPLGVVILSAASTSMKKR